MTDKNNTAIKKYLKDVDTLKKSGEGREESYYPILKTLLDEIANHLGEKDIKIIPSPRKAEWNNPDFKIVTNNDIIGYIEAKKPGTDMIKIEKSDQLKGYIKFYDNLITTNFHNFRLFRNGTIIKEVVLENTKESKKFDELNELISIFFGFSTPEIFTAGALAKKLAGKTKMLRNQVKDDLKASKEEVVYLHNTFNEFLMSNIDHEKFAEIFSQTITYGLFISKMRVKNPENFNQRNAFSDIPDKFGVLKAIFTYISTSKGIVNEEMGWIVDDIINVLRNTEIKKLFKEYHDPVIHFYETFLEEYDPKIRKSQGVYYTPDPVVSYITESVNFILKDKFNKKDGFADKSVKVLDPASGTMTFMSKAIEIAVREYPFKGAIDNLIRDRILKNFYAFEVMMAPYTIGHLRMMLMLDDMGYSIDENDRFNLYLTNTLGGDITQPNLKKFLPYLEKELQKESNIAEEIKRKTKVLAILGNPPYSINSKNGDDFILKLIEDYKKIGKNKIEEKNTKLLQDDYVKFIRFAQDKIDKNGEGVIGFITNHGFLDNITFRGMRHSLIESFNEIYILDLHGNSTKKEVCPDGSKDENVFNIMNGVSISFFIKKKDVKGIKVYHKDLWGMQEEKYEWLLKNNFENTDWEELEPNEPNYLFNPQNEEHRKQYELGWKVTDIFQENISSIVTARDKLTIQFTEDEMWNVVQDFSTLSEEDARTNYNLPSDTHDWKVKSAQEVLKHDGPKKSSIYPITYRPFDTRYTYYMNKVTGFISAPRYNIMQHMLKENSGLCIGRQWGVIGSKTYDIAFITDKITDKNLFRRGGANLFPLYLHKTKKESNINSKFMKCMPTTVSPEQVLYYIYGVLYSGTYRDKYSEFLKRDFPRIPLTTSKEIFLKISLLGEQIAKLHLMTSNELGNIISTFPVEGNDIIEKVKREGNSVYINKTQYFDGIEEDVWNYEIGGYKVLDKWLKSHKGRELNLEDIEHFSRIVTALSKTIELQVEIDELYPDIEKDIIEYDEDKINPGWFSEHMQK